MEKILETITKEIIKVREYLHSIPETGFNEVKTSQFIKDELKKIGFEVNSIAKTGVIGYRKGKTTKKAIAFRADMDALEVLEETGLSYASKEKGKMHACGHDGHMSILLGFAMYLSKFKEIERDVVLIFQPAEEGPGGAKVILNEGLLEKYNIDCIFGLHILPDLEEGKIGVKSGSLMAATGEFDIIIKSKGGHGAMPHTAIDGIYVASQLINGYQSIVSRNIEPIEGAVVTIGKIEGGKARNIIADEIKMEGTIRAFDSEVYNIIKKRMKDINEGLEKMYSVDIDMRIRDMYPAVVNDEELYNILKEVLEEKEIIEMKPMMISEDFSFYQKEIPGLFFMLGSRNEKLGYTYPLHNAHFNFNEEILTKGVKVYIKISKKLGILK